ncbi:hypothetical protein FOCG_18439 [Fusarium oxysporum f. sp. radicis-lycopersici 26381]|nr:hypothetical protein FOCG_18439 [Fusarium oxysporum f. sp. radicis-lycopersici 26381]
MSSRNWHTPTTCGSISTQTTVSDGLTDQNFQKSGTTPDKRIRTIPRAAR